MTNDRGSADHHRVMHQRHLPFSRSNPEDAWHARSTISSGSSSMAYRKQMQEQERLVGAGALSSLAGRFKGLFKDFF